MLDVATIQVTDLPCCNIEQRGDLPECKAIYFVLSEAGRILYIGKSVNLFQRWIGHHRLPQFGEMMVKIAWLELSADVDNAALHAIEKECIKHFKPLTNGPSKEVDDTGIAIEGHFCITDPEVIKSLSSAVHSGKTLNHCINVALRHYVTRAEKANRYMVLKQKMRDQAVQLSRLTDEMVAMAQEAENA